MKESTMYIETSPDELRACLEEVLTDSQLQSLRIRESVGDSSDGGTRSWGTEEVLLTMLSWYAGGVLYDVTKAGVLTALGDETAEKIRNAVKSRFGRDSVVHEEETDDQTDA